MSVTGPFTRTVSKGNDYHNAIWYRQSRPRTRPLPYKALKQKGITVDNRYDPPLRPYKGPGTWLFPHLNSIPVLSGRAYNTAYDKFVGNVKSSASLGLTFAEGNQSLEMITKRTKQFLEAYRATRRGDISGIILSLGLRRESPRVKRAVKRSKGFSNPQSRNYIRDESKRASSTYLEWIFGWKPLIKDIGDAVDVLQREFPSRPVFGTGSSIEDINESIWPHGPADRLSILKLTKVRIQSTVTVSNPNISLANELGFVNPIQVAWEMIPFSFLFDWFVPVGRFLGSFTDLMGFKLDNTFVTATVKASSNSRWSSSWVSVSTEESGAAIQREPLATLPIPGLADRVKFPSEPLDRAATMVALAIQIFSGSSR